MALTCLILHRRLVRERAPPGLLRLPRLLGDGPRHGPPPHRRERPHLAGPADGDHVNIQPLLDALGIQEDAARAPADGLSTQITELQTRLREAETHLEHLAITRKTVTVLADRLPARANSPDLPEHPDRPRILAVFNDSTGPLRARDVCEALNHELLPKNKWRQETSVVIAKTCKSLSGRAARAAGTGRRESLDVAVAAAGVTAEAERGGVHAAGEYGGC
jgi:hypothetical protein